MGWKYWCLELLDVAVVVDVIGNFDGMKFRLFGVMRRVAVVVDVIGNFDGMEILSVWSCWTLLLWLWLMLLGTLMG